MTYIFDDREWIIMDSDDEPDNLSEFIPTLSIQNESQNDYYSVLCIDIGIVNLGIAALIYDKNTMVFREVVGIDLLDITTFLHRPSEICCLNHTKTFTDWMEHVFQYHKNVFEGVDKILIERQPPCGFVAVEQLIYSRYRYKCELVAPNSVHKYFNIGKLDYDSRKNKVIEIALKHISDPEIIDEFNKFSRQHDMADAICIGLYWLSKKHTEYLEEENICRLANIRLVEEQIFKTQHGITMDEYLAQFRWKPRKAL
jgi:hypothetical protein